jgi:hypothetical protein
LKPTGALECAGPRWLHPAHAGYVKEHAAPQFRADQGCIPRTRATLKDPFPGGGEASKGCIPRTRATLKQRRVHRRLVLRPCCTPRMRRHARRRCREGWVFHRHRLPHRSRPETAVAEEATARPADVPIRSPRSGTARSCRSLKPPPASERSLSSRRCVAAILSLRLPAIKSLWADVPSRRRASSLVKRILASLV